MSALTDAERQAWCEWFVAATQDPPKTELTPTSDGYYQGSTCTGSINFYCNGVEPTKLPVSACVDNLALSPCTATVFDLTDCALTIAGGCTPAPYGCARYFEEPGCSGTIVIANSNEPDAGGWGGYCSLRVQ